MNIKNGFSIAEAMIVLLVVSIAMAAMAPLVSKRTLRGVGGSCEWVVTDNNKDIVRPNSNVRIGGDAVTDPNATLEVVLSDGSKQAQWITVPAGQNADILRVYRTGSGAGLGGVTDLIARIDKSGVYSPDITADPGMVSFFALSACPPGWHEADGNQPVGSGVARPNLRGKFIKGWDGTGTVGGAQDDAMQGHKHDYYIQYGPSGSTTYGLHGVGNHMNLTVTSTSDEYFQLNGVYTDFTYGTARKSTETRPKNVALLACVKE